METLMAMVMAFEGFSPVLYDDAGYLAVGYGHQVRGEYAPLYRQGVTINKARKLLRYDLVEAQRMVDTYVDIELTENQRNALTSLVFNIGEGAFSRSKGLEYLNEGDLRRAAHEFFSEKIGFVKSRGKVLKGLVKRRAKERELFFTP